jgi:hypothetical protein
MKVAAKPAKRLHFNASRTPVLSTALDHHRVVRLDGGHEKVLLALKELITTTESGM